MTEIIENPPVEKLVLAKCWDNDATLQFVNTHATLGTWQAIDVTRLEPVTFIVPENGMVELEYQGVGDTGTGSNIQWGVHNGTGIVPESVVNATITGFDTANHKVSQIVSGLTPGQEVTWTWYHRRSVGASGSATVWGGRDASAFGPAKMEIRPFV